MSYLTLLAETLERLGLAGARVVVGVSGGADSVALLRGLHELAPSAGLVLHAAHLNHRIRPDAAEEDAEWTRKLCDSLGIPIVIEEADVPARAQAERLNIEEAARFVRYEFFERTARLLACSRVAVAHTADDCVETVLFHLFRGTGMAGLRGMRQARRLADGIALVRPLSGIQRPMLEGWLSEIGQDYRTDATNADESRTRNRIRHVLLPSLEREFGSQVRDSLLRLARQADELQSAIEEQAERLLQSSLVDESDEICRLDVVPLEGQPRHLVREVFVALWRRKNWRRRQMGFDDWDRLYRLLDDGSRIDLPGRVSASRRGTLIAFQRHGNLP